MMKHSSGIAAVDEIGKIHFTGNIVPDEWYGTIQKESGKPYHLAIAILSDIVFWYRPVEIRDEATGKLVRWQKKFKGDMLQKSYRSYEKKLRESRRSVKEAIDFLVRIGAVIREFRDVKTIGDGILRNVMYLSAVPDVILSLTYPEDDGTSSGHSDQKSAEEETETDDIYCGDEDVEGAETPSVTGVDVHDESPGAGSYKNAYDVVQKNAPPPAKKRTTSCTEANHVLRDYVPHPAGNWGTNTEINTETTTENTTEITRGVYHSPIHLSVNSPPARKKDGLIDQTVQRSKAEQIGERAEGFRSMIRQHIRYDWHMEHDDSIHKKLYSDLYTLMCDVVSAEYDSPIRINGGLYAPDDVVGRMLMIREEHLVYICEKLAQNPNENGVRNERAYMLACLYNAPVTFGTHIQQRVNHDMNSGVWYKADQTKEENRDV